MSPDANREQWLRVDSVLAQALERDAGDRVAFVTEECGSEPAVFREVLALLSALDEVGSFLEKPAEVITEGFWDQIRSTIPSPDPDRIGEVVGAYRLLREIGRGGMGAVYLAERSDEEFERLVAIKLLRPELDLERVGDRLRSERQILASLNHPNIAQLLDGGTTEDGQPFLVMEYVDGTRIDEYCDRRRLTVRRRLELFLDVLTAVEHAHRHLIVHRDIKPSNILVTDRDASPKLLDFGIAKLVDPSMESDDATLTVGGSRFLTPGYAAPEQLLGERVRTETDVYALTAVLYELLTGIRPYSGAHDRSVLERVVSGDVAQRASEAALLADGASAGGGDGGIAPADRARARSTTPDRLRRTLRGDLDAILSRGLRSRPEERYGSVDLLREDVQRFLQNRPVRARGEAALYTARKFLQRHWVSVGAAAAFVALLGGSAVGLAIQRSAVFAERNRAETEAATAGEVTDFLVSLFESADPQQSGDTVTATFLLERGTERIEKELSNQPEVMARLLEATGAAYRGLGVYENAVSNFEKAESIWRQSPTLDRGAVARNLLQRAEALFLARDFEAALPIYREGIQINPRESREDSLRWVELAGGYGSTLRNLGQFDEAESWIRRALDTVERVADSDAWLVNQQTHLAGLLSARGEHDEAATLYRSILTDRRRLEGLDHPQVGIDLNNLAVALRRAGRNREAADVYEEALALLTRRVGRGHPDALMAGSNMATALVGLGALDQAVEVYRENVRAAERQWPAGHWRLAREYMYLGAQLLVASRPDEAIDPLRQAAETNTLVLGSDHPETGVFEAWLGAALALAERDAEAARMFDRAARTLVADGTLKDNRVASGMLGALVNYMSDWGIEAADRFGALLR